MEIVPRKWTDLWSVCATTQPGISLEVTKESVGDAEDRCPRGRVKAVHKRLHHLRHTIEDEFVQQVREAGLGFE